MDDKDNESEDDASVDFGDCGLNAGELVAMRKLQKKVMTKMQMLKQEGADLEEIMERLDLSGHDVRFFRTAYEEGMELDEGYGAEKKPQRLFNQSYENNDASRQKVVGKTLRRINQRLEAIALGGEEPGEQEMDVEEESQYITSLGGNSTHYLTVDSLNNASIAG